MASISIRQIKKTFPSSDGKPRGTIKVIDGVNLDVTDGEFVSFFGPNGCGKTTFLIAIAGLSVLDEGTIRIQNQHSNHGRVGMIFQNYRESLYPWLTNIDNVAFPLEIQGIAKRHRRKKAAEFLTYLGLDIPGKGYPYQLSGGQQQLLSLARALIFEADVLLMDEPFASLDYSTRFYARDRVQDILAKTKTTTLFVSHSLEEAIYLADRLVLFSNKPMRILTEIPVNLSRPRTAETLEDERFFHIHAQALRIFKEEMRK